MSRLLERLLQIDGFLRSKHRQTSDTLAIALEIRKDLAFLRDRSLDPAGAETSSSRESAPKWEPSSLPSIGGYLGQPGCSS